MASYTTNLNLKKPAGSENVAIGDINNNMDTIDTAYGTLNSNLSSFVKYKEISATTTSSGAVQIPSNIGANRILSAQYSDGKTGLIYKRDGSYFTCVDSSFNPYNNVSVTFIVIYLDNAPSPGT